MKKITLILTAFLTLVLSSCTKDEYITEVVEPYTYTQRYTVTDNDWKEDFDDSGRYYYCQIREPNLTNEVFDYGVMQAFLYYTQDGRNTASPLPFSDFIVDQYGYKWEEQLSVEFQPGYITFILKIDDHADSYSLYPSYDFLVRFLW
ncbi:MAG: hypothetical protein LBO74_09870 [Candidatus Symbiothrix sp.]|jgi:hypothetical protein|nr:hypothetical protein [Candidatus Symbiothrix sp.]